MRPLLLLACVAVSTVGCDSSNARNHASFDTLADTHGTSYAHWLPEDLPASATELDITTDVDASVAWFEYDAPADAVPASCVASGPAQYACGTDDRYTLAYAAEDGRWSGRLDY